MAGRTGRRPLPTRLKLLHGETRPSRLNPAEPQPEQGRPPKPAGLKGLAAKEWDRLAELATSMGALTTADGPMLEATAIAYQEMQDALRVRRREGAYYTARTKAGGLMRRKHPCLDVAAEAWRRYVMGLGHFGLSPASRTKVQTARPEERLGQLAKFISGDSWAR